MSRAGTMLLQEQENKESQSLSQTISRPIWTEATNELAIQDKNFCSATTSIGGLEVDSVLDRQAREMNISLYQIVQQLSQSIVSSVQLLYSTSFAHLVQEQDIWVEMPPRSVKGTVMNVQFMGRGEPPEFPDEFWEE